MRTAFATLPAIAGRPNEDFAAATANAVVLLDGAGTPAGADSGCSHGVAWYARSLGAALLAELEDLTTPPTTCLETAIRTVAFRHEAQCDLTHPGTPSATVIAVRAQEDTIEYLVLADSVLLLRTEDEATAITDDREAQVGQRYRTEMDALPAGTAEHRDALRSYVETMRQHRNAPGGFWVAAADPAAAAEAITGSIPTQSVRDLALLSDGASRIADRFKLWTWDQVLDVLASDGGPEDLINAVRAAEASDPDGTRWPRGKTNDDATTVYASN